MNHHLHPVIAEALRPLVELERSVPPLAAEIDRLRAEIKSADSYADAILAKHNAVIAAYEVALKDEGAKIPTYLHAAIEALR